MQKKKTGRKPKVITPEIMYEKGKAGATKAEIAKEIGLNPNYFCEVQNKNPELAVAYERGAIESREQFATRMKPLIMTAYQKRVAEGDTASILFGMRAVVGFQETQKIEHTGAHGGPIELANVTTRELEEKFEQLKRVELESSAKIKP